jgi:hypothetical protein
MTEGSIGTSVRGSESHEGTRECLKGPIGLTIDVLFWLYFSIFCGYFQLFLVYFYMLCGHSVAQEIHHLWQFTSGFIGPQILNFARSLSLSPVPKVVLFRSATFPLEALFQYVITSDYPFRNETKSEWSRQQIENRGNNVSNGKRRWRQIWGCRTFYNKLGIGPYQWDTECLSGDVMAGNAPSFPLAIFQIGMRHSHLIHEEVIYGILTGWMAWVINTCTCFCQ